MQEWRETWQSKISEVKKSMNDELKSEIAKARDLCDRLEPPAQQVLRSTLSALELAIEQRDACAHRNHALDASKRACELDEDNAAILAALRGEA